MENSPSRKRAEARAAQRRLQAALRQELRRRQVECRYVGQCPVAQAGNCPGIC
ncbi:MAG TPA: hypothetical protein VGR61_07775 [Candidatus Dormibacteraeota bacterium]|nr:hypothetical protein [Candidatus Dormibacteraeota bacterium]